MEFIPIEKYSKKGKKKGAVVTESKPKKVQKNETIDKSPQTRGKHKPQRKIIEKKEVKKKIKENVSKKKVLKKAGKKKKKQKKEDEEEEEKEEQEEEEEEEMELDEGENEEVGDAEESEEAEEEEDEEPDEDEDEEAFRKKCKEMDDMKKNRLFLKLKTKILNEAQIKKLHPDIKSVILPRKKNSRWCWAVFVSEERANGAMKKLIKNKDVLVNKPTPYERVVKKRKEKLKTVLRKKQAKKKLQKMWM